MKHTFNFFDQIFEIENGLPNIYSNIFFEKDNKCLYPREVNTSQNNDSSFHKLYNVQFVPDYMVPKLTHPDRFNVKKVSHVKGYAAHLSDFSDVDSYLKNQFRSNAKSIRRYVNRLETCFNINYKLYFGHIDRLEYEFIMNTLEKMKENRFGQRDDQDESLAYWDYTFKITFDLINNKRASLFVIYDEQKPIEISLNYHFNGILYSSNSSYDIDYSKFGLGHVEIYKQIEWCIANDYLIFEMGRGDLDYKRRWSNLIYNFEYHLVYQKRCIWAKLYACVMENLLKLKVYLKSKNIHKYVLRAKKLLSSRNHNKAEDSITFKTSPIDDKISLPGLKPIDFSNAPYSFLKKSIFDFLYSSSEHVTNIEVFEVENEDFFIVKGKHKKIKIVKEL
ncbi:GNAT family N-acetyltransferase [Arenibacter sp. F26102]|uniref:GNAT family N-acetyltransferase n=1 Tax=Arenibacter sp. F26102 TaxID=2926416 RepID=UPI001FF3139C|nr:GNAT family N-acetyltransferase [Arenibacter sp. F26102]MCK0147066.1 GNAT family N-acetyltransferase [Arenibacter sp. F26102]